MQRVRRALTPWGALFALSLLFELPTAMRPDGVDPTAMRPTLEVPLLLGLYGASLQLSRGGRALRVLLLAWTLVLVVARIDHAIFFALMRTNPLLYDQLFMLRHLFVLFGDLWSVRTAGVLGASIAGLAAAVWLSRRLLRVWRRAFEPELRRRSFAVLGGYLVLLAVGAAVPAGKTGTLVRAMTPELADNLARSVHAYRSVGRGIRESPYRDYAALKLSRKPDVLLFVIESYGRVLARHPVLRQRWNKRLARMEKSLSSGGWSMASAFSRAPVSGARSWLSEASMLLGAPVIYEAVFRHLLGELDRVPSLPSVLHRLGYTTVLLAPADRRRPGVEKVNAWGYDQHVTFDELHYGGPRVGWGLVPDQYSLQHTDLHVLSLVGGPLFFDFHMVSSHAPWRQIPVYLPDWRQLGRSYGTPLEDPRDHELEKRLQRYAREDPRWSYMGRFGAGMRTRYVHSIDYVLQVVERYLRSRERDALVILIGDHQPPVVAAENESFDVPVHVLARDPALLEELFEHGFTPGLSLDPEAPTPLHHEGLLSLCMRLLARCCSKAETLPAYLPRGFDLAGTGDAAGDE